MSHGVCMSLCLVFQRFICFAEATTPVEESAHNQLSKLASITLDVARLSSGDRPRFAPPLDEPSLKLTFS